MTFTLILVIMTGLISYQALANPAMKNRLIFHPASIKNHGEWYRFITHGFIHANWGHLFINLFVLWQFGEVIESFFNHMLFGPALGKIMFLLLYLSAIVIAAIPDFFRHQNNDFYASLGASGATSALVFAYILLDPWQWFLFPPLPAIILAVVYLWYSSYMSRHGNDNIAHNAHLWGAVYGLAFMIISAITVRPELVQYFIARLMEGPSVPAF